MQKMEGDTACLLKIYFGTRRIKSEVQMVICNLCRCIGIFWASGVAAASSLRWLTFQQT